MLQHLCTCVEFKVPIHKHLDLYFFQTAVPWGYSSTAVLFSHSLGAVSVSSLTCWQWEQERGSIANSSIPISTLKQLSQIPYTNCPMFYLLVVAAPLRLSSEGSQMVLIDVNHHSYEFQHGQVSDISVIFAPKLAVMVINLVKFSLKRLVQISPLGWSTLKCKSCSDVCLFYCNRE